MSISFASANWHFCTGTLASRGILQPGNHQTHRKWPVAPVSSKFAAHAALRGRCADPARPDLLLACFVTLVAVCVGLALQTSRLINQLVVVVVVVSHVALGDLLVDFGRCKDATNLAAVMKTITRRRPQRRRRRRRSRSAVGHLSTHAGGGGARWTMIKLDITRAANTFHFRMARAAKPAALLANSSRLGQRWKAPLERETFTSWCCLFQQVVIELAAASSGKSPSRYVAASAATAATNPILFLFSRSLSSAPIRHQHHAIELTQQRGLPAA